MEINGVLDDHPHLFVRLPCATAEILCFFQFKIQTQQRVNKKNNNTSKNLSVESETNTMDRTLNEDMLKDQLEITQADLEKSRVALCEILVLVETLKVMMEEHETPVFNVDRSRDLPANVMATLVCPCGISNPIRRMHCVGCGQMLPFEL